MEFFVPTLGDRRAPPPRIFAPRHVPAAKFGGTAVALAHDLLRFRNSRIPFPGHARALTRLIAIDIARAQEAHAAAATHHNGKVLVPQLSFGRVVDLKIEYVLGVSIYRRQIDHRALTEERRIVAAPVAVVGGNRLCLGDKLRRRRRF